MGSDTSDTGTASERDKRDMIDGDFIRRFVPDAPEQADIPMIRFEADDIVVLRGELPSWLTPARLRQARRHASAVVGVVFNDLGDVELAAEGDPFEDVRHHSALWINNMISGSSAEELLSSLDRVREAIIERRDKGWVVAHGDSSEVFYTRR